MSSFMLITLPRLGTIATNYLVVFEREGITELADLERRIGEEIPVDADSGERIILRLRPSDMGTQSCVADYILAERGGIPIRITMNRLTHHAHLILKAPDLISGYSILALDPFGNKTQYQTFNTITLAEVTAKLSLVAAIDIASKEA